MAAIKVGGLLADAKDPSQAKTERISLAPFAPGRGFPGRKVSEGTLYLPDILQNKIPHRQPTKYKNLPERGSFPDFEI
jgi:hypothetical protein